MRKPHDFYANFELDDFLNDDDFKTWVKYPTHEDHAYWLEVSNRMPQKKAVIAQAKDIIFLLSQPVIPVQEESQQRIWMNVEKHMTGESQKHQPVIRNIFVTWQRIAVAAVLVTMLSVGLYTYVQKINSNSLENELAAAKQIPAGGNRATLILADGRTIDLNQTANGKLAEEAGITVEKTSDGRLIYRAKNNKGGDEDLLTSNTVSTPRGGQYELILPDQTHVWLNAASSIKYPVSFHHAQQRLVELSGEAYFEVTPNKHLPFIVRTANQEVKVLGTHFNINSYTEEGKTVTTLEEGAVKVTTPASSLTASLQPGQQSILAGASLQVKPADLETTLAWKNGRLEFKDANIKTIMREVSRWYNIDVEYKGEVSDRLFVGSVPRQSNLSTLLQLLKLSNVNFHIQEGKERKKLIVMPDK